MSSSSPTSRFFEKSVLARYGLLLDALKYPEKMNPIFLISCKSQSAFAALSLPAHEIYPISRNTMYKHADILLFDKQTPDKRTGRYYLDWLRKEVEENAKKNQPLRSKRSIHDRSEKRLEDLQQKLKATEAANLIRGSAYLHLIQSIKFICKNHDINDIARFKLQNAIEDHQVLYGDIFCETETLLSSNNVERIR